MEELRALWFLALGMSLAGLVAAVWGLVLSKRPARRQARVTIDWMTTHERRRRL